MGFKTQPPFIIKMVELKKGKVYKDTSKIPDIKKEHPEAYKFFRQYANLPVILRERRCVKIYGNWRTYDAVYFELNKKTRLGYNCMVKMIKMGLI